MATADDALGLDDLRRLGEGGLAPAFNSNLNRLSKSLAKPRVHQCPRWKPPLPQCFVPSYSIFSNQAKGQRQENHM